MSFPPDREDVTASVIGLGYVGSCLAATLADRGLRVFGVDVNELLVEEIAGGGSPVQEPGLTDLLAQGTASGRLTVGTDYARTAESDVVIVAVGTPVHGRGELADTQVRGACEELSRHLRPGQLVIVKSTLPPGTMRRLVAPLLEKGGLRCGTDIGLAFCPERLSQGTALAELRSLPVVVSGITPRDAERAERFWRRALGVETIPCSSLETAEVVKLANNWWIDHNIALANELGKFCSAVGVDVMEVIGATNSAPKGGGNINVLLPGVGVGGSCLTKDPWMVWRTAREHGLDLRSVTTAREINDGMPGYTARLILDEIAKAGKRPDQARVAILGLAFKNDTGDVRSTPTAPVVAALADAGAEVVLYDPLVDPAEAEKTFRTGLAPTAEAAAEGADCLAILAWHREFADLSFADLRTRVSDRCVVVDGRAHFPRSTVESLTGLGFAFRGIGR
jgi:UDP-N-acetyl-D-mannosaminuronic acid dehydrogenase